MVISLPESYSILKTILMSTKNRLSPDSIIAQVLIEEKSQKNPVQTALLAHRKKEKEKDIKKDKEKKEMYLLQEDRSFGKGLLKEES